MSEPTLVVRFDDLATIIKALQTGHDDLTKRVTTMRADVAAFVADWAPDTDSRRSQQDFDRRLAQWTEELAAALKAIRDALAETTVAAHTAEVRNVALLD